MSLHIKEEKLTIIFHPNPDGTAWQRSSFSDLSEYTLEQGNTKSMLYAAAEFLDRDYVECILIDDGTGLSVKIK